LIPNSGIIETALKNPRALADTDHVIQHSFLMGNLGFSMSDIESDSNSHLVAQEIVGGIAHMSTLPEVTMRIIDIIEDPNSSARDLHQVVSSDPALSSRILKVVNSSFYGMPRQIGSINRSISLLGLNAVKNLAIAASLGHIFRFDGALPHFQIRDLWDHSMKTAAASCLVARHTGSQSTDEAFLAGLLHDIGFLVELQHDSVMFTSMIETITVDHDGAPNIDLPELERATFQTDHQSIGAVLCEQWKFPRSLVSATAHHHDPSVLTGDESLVPWFVHMGDHLVANLPGGFRLDLMRTSIHEHALEALRMDEAGFHEILDQINGRSGEIEFSLAA
jgi:putative nucleotidyltransferase with HDIG domain